MITSTPALHPIMSLLWRPSGAARLVALAALGSIALALSAKVEVRFWPVPMTMQTLVVMLIGVAYGTRLAAATVLAYLGEGLLGLPVFAGAGSGAGYMVGPTGGYLLGFLLAAVLTGWLAERGWDRSVAGAAGAMALGHLLLFIPGVLWLAALFGWPKAVAFGIAPFIVATLFKTAFGVAIVASFWSVFRRYQPGRG